MLIVQLHSLSVMLAILDLLHCHICVLKSGDQFLKTTAGNLMSITSNLY